MTDNERGIIKPVVDKSKSSVFEGSVNPLDLVFEHKGVHYSIDVSTDNESFYITKVVDINGSQRYGAGSYEYVLASLHLRKTYKRLSNR